jgi:hypothetical protein
MTSMSTQTRAETRPAQVSSFAPLRGILQRKCACGGSSGVDGECAECRRKRLTLQRRSTQQPGLSTVPPIVHDVLRSPGQPLDHTTRAFMEPRFGYGFSQVRVHTDAQATDSAQAVNALAYTVGRDVVFGAGQYAPQTSEGRRLLAHELTHVVQQNNGNNIQTQSLISDHTDVYEREADNISAGMRDVGAKSSLTELPHVRTPYIMLQRTPASKVSCAGSSPLHIPGEPPLEIADPVAVITAAENQANALLDGAISELDFTRQQILAGSPIGWPTISDSLAQGLRLLGLNPDEERFWRGSGQHTAALLLRRLRLIRGTIGAGSFFFTCLGPRVGSIGSCSGDICVRADARSCGGSFLIDLCEGFWRRDPDVQGSEILHESTHNFADFIQDRAVEREGIAACYVRFAETVAGIDETQQRVDLCPNP